MRKNDNDGIGTRLFNQKNWKIVAYAGEASKYHTSMEKSEGYSRS